MVARGVSSKRELLPDQSRETVQRRSGTTADAIPHQLADASGRESADSERRQNFRDCRGGRVRLGGGVQSSLQEGDGRSSRDMEGGSAVNALGTSLDQPQPRITLVRQDLVNCGRGGGGPEVVPLPQNAAQPEEGGALFRALNPLGDSLQLQGVAQTNDRSGQRRTVGSLTHVLDEGLRDLEDIDGESL